MRLTTCWGLWLGLLSLCSLIALPPSPRAEEHSLERLETEAFCLALPSRCRTGAIQTTTDHLRHLDGLPLPPVLSPPRQAPDQPAASAPPEDPIASDCRYVGFQTEWVASKGDAGLPLGEALAAARRVFARDMPEHEALFGALGPLVYRAPQRSPTDLRQAIEAACRAHPRRWTGHHADGVVNLFATLPSP